MAAYDADQANGLNFLVMEYVEGRNLADHLAEKGPLPIAEACDVIRQAALGLQHAHERGMVHRDIKPHNLMRTSSGRVKVLDFGLARFAAEPETPVSAATLVPHLTGAGAVVGTADYIAPEQARDAHGADGRADIYSLGCTLYHLLTGRPPFPDGLATEKLQHHAVDEPTSLRRLRPEVPEALAAVLERMMAKRPENRYADVAAVAAALATYARPPRSRRRRLKSLALLVAVFALMVATAFIAVTIVRLKAGLDQEPAVEAVHPGAQVVIKEPADSQAVDKATPAERPVGHGVVLVHEWTMKSAPGVGYASVDFAENGRRVIAAYTDPRTRAREVYAWEAGSGKEAYRFFPPGPSFERLVVSPDGKRLLVLFLDWPKAALQLRDARSGQEIRTFGQDRSARFWSAAFLPDSRHAVTGGEEGVMRLWNVETGMVVHEFAWRDGPIMQVTVSPDGKWALASTARDARLWNLKTGATLRSFLNSEIMAAQSFSPDGGRLLLTSPPHHDVRVIDTTTWAEVTRLCGHTDRVRGAAFLPNGKVVTGANGSWGAYGMMMPGDDRTVRLWETDTGRELARWEGSPGGVCEVAIAPDRRHVAVAGGDGVARLFRLPRPDSMEMLGEVRRLIGHGKSHVHRIVVSPEGRFAWSVGDDFRKWDLSTGKLLQRVATHHWFEELLPFPDAKRFLMSDGWGGLRVYDAAIMAEVRAFGKGVVPRFGQAAWVKGADGKPGRFLTGGEDGIARLWDLAAGRIVQELHAHPRSLLCVDASPNGELALTASNADRTLCVWDLKHGKELYRLSEQANAARFTWDGRGVLSCGLDGVIRLFDAHTGQELRTFRSSRKAVVWDRLYLMPGGRHFMTAGADLVLRLWDFDTGAEIYRADLPAVVCALAATPDQRYALLGTEQGEIIQWRLPGLSPPLKIGPVRRFGGGQGQVGRVQFLPGGVLALASGNPVSLWNVWTGQKVRDIQPPNVLITWSYACAVSLDGKHAFTGKDLWDLDTGKKLRTVEGGDNLLWGVAFSPDGRRAVFGCEGELEKGSNTLWLSDVDTGKLVKRLGKGEGARSVAYSPDGSRVAAGHYLTSHGERSFIRVYEVATGKEIRALEVPTTAGSVTFSPDGKQLLSANATTIRLWDLASGMALKRFEGHTVPVEWVVFTPDGRRIVSAGGDHTVRVWDVASGKELHCFTGHTNAVLGVAVSPDGRNALSGSRDGTLRVWRLPDPSLNPKQIADADPVPSQPALERTGVARPLTAFTRAFHEIHGADQNTFQAWLDNQANEVFRPVTLSVLAGSSQPRFNGIAIRDGQTPPTSVRIGMAPGEPAAHFQQMCAHGYRPLVACMYVEAGQQKQAHLWIKDGTVFGGYGISLGQLQTVLEREGLSKRMMPIYLSAELGSHSVDNTTIILAPDTGLKWEVKTIRATDDLYRLATDYRLRGWRLIRIAACADANGRRLLTVARENPERADWDYRVDLTEPEYEKTLAEQDDLGLGPVAVASYLLKIEVRYAAVWQRYRTPKRNTPAPVSRGR